MSAKHYFPDSFSCRCSQILPIRSTTSAPTQGSLSGCSGGASGVYDDDDGDDDIREGGGSDAGGGVPSLSLSLPSSHDCYRFAYNSALQNDLKKKCHPSRVERWKTSKVFNFQWGGKKKVYPPKQQAAQNLIR